MIPRLQEKNIEKALSENKIILIMGPRQVGKTTLLQTLINKLAKDKKNSCHLYLNCDLEEDKDLINTFSLTRLKKLTEKLSYLFIDEAQRLTDPGLTLKIIHDQLPSVKIIATGSSSFQLRNKITETLTGRYLLFYLYPFSLEEVTKKSSFFYLLTDSLLYGLYPEVYLKKKPEEKINLLTNIVESYLFKDIFSFQKIRYPQIIQDLTKSLAYQIGSEINENELASRLKIDRKTVVSYLDILEQGFIIKKIYPYSRNPRREIGRKYKIYFFDLGIRNALIGDFNPPKLRKDLGGLWENFLVIERLKYCANHQRLANHYFWRRYGGAEIDYLEQSRIDGKIIAYEIKWQNNKISRAGKEFKKRYHLPIIVVNQDNFQDFVA